MANSKQSKTAGTMDVHAMIFISKYVRRGLSVEEFNLVCKYMDTLCLYCTDKVAERDAECERILALSRENPLFNVD